MKARWLACALLAVSVAASSVPASGSHCPLGGDGKIYDLDLDIARGDDPEVVRGPVTLCLYNLNRLRYATTIGQEVSFEAGPDLAIFGPFPDLGAPAGEEDADAKRAGPDAAAGPGTRTADTSTPGQSCVLFTGEVEDRANQIENCLATLEGAITNAERAATTAMSKIAAQRSAVSNLVQQSDQTLRGDGGAKALAGRVRTLQMQVEDTLGAPEASWPSASGLAPWRRKLQRSATALGELKYEAGWGSWIGSTQNYRRYVEFQQQAEDLTSRLDALQPTSNAAKAFQEAKVDLRRWSAILAPLRQEDAFTMTVKVRCGFPFFETKNQKYIVNRVDRTIEDKDKNKSTQALAQVVCPSRFTLSAGIAATGIEERDFAFVPSSEDAGVTQIGLANHSDEQINPAVFLSTRLGSWSHSGEPGAYGFYFTAGTVADYDNPEGGLRFGYLLGLSMSFMDHFLLTTGVAGSRVNELAGGFTLDDVRPEGLTEIPVTKEWQFGWVFGVSYQPGGGG